MLGRKKRAFGPLPPVTLKEQVPPDHCFRPLERTLDLGFVRDLVRNAYAVRDRPSIDPVVFFELHLAPFFEGIRSEPRVMRVVPERRDWSSPQGTLAFASPVLMPYMRRSCPPVSDRHKIPPRIAPFSTRWGVVGTDRLILSES